MDKATKNKIEKLRSSLAETNAYIEKESARSEDLRPQEIKELLAFYIGHKDKLEKWISELAA